MRSSDFLFRLIKSLSKGDRRNLRLYGGLQEGDKKYFHLFDAIDAQHDYDEAAIIEQFEGERFLNQLSVAKNYLYNYILKTLHIFHRDQHAELNVLIHQVEILIGKNLYDQAAKLVRKGKQVAARQERFQELLTLLAYQRRVSYHTERPGDNLALLATIKEEELATLITSANLISYMQLSDEVAMVTRTVPGKPSSQEKAKEILNHELLVEATKALGQKAAILRLESLVSCFTFLGDTEKAYQTTLELISIYQVREEIRIEWNGKFLLALASAGELAYRMGDVPAALSALNDLRKAEVYCHEESVRVFERYYHFKIALCLEIGDAASGFAAIEDFEHESKALNGHLRRSEELAVFYVSAYFLLAAGEPQMALAWIKKIISEPRSELRMDLQCMARILSMVIHYELHHYDMIEYLGKSAARFINSRGHLHQVEKISLRYLKKLAIKDEGQNDDALWEAFDQEIQAAVDADPTERKLLDLFDVRAWIAVQKKGDLLVNHFKSTSKK